MAVPIGRYGVADGRVCFIQKYGADESAEPLGSVGARPWTRRIGAGTRVTLEFESSRMDVAASTFPRPRGWSGNRARLPHVMPGERKAPASPLSRSSSWIIALASRSRTFGPSRQSPHHSRLLQSSTRTLASSIRECTGRYSLLVTTTTAVPRHFIRKGSLTK